MNNMHIGVGVWIVVRFLSGRAISNSLIRENERIVQTPTLLTNYLTLCSSQGRRQLSRPELKE